MKHLITYLPIVLITAACASDESARRDPDTTVEHRHHHRTDAEIAADPDAPADADRTVARDRLDRHDVGVKPVPVAAAPAAADPNAPATNDNLSDAEITRRIHNAVNEDNSLTAEAKSVNITTEDRHVTLRGNVTSDREKNTVETYAKQVAGTGNVQNKLDVR